MKTGVITFPGSNCDQDILRVLRDFFGHDTTLLWHGDRIEGRFDLLVVPGGFSYGDYLRCGAIARFAPAMQDVIAHAKHGGFVFGICNGFQILCEAGLLPGALVRNRTLKHICRPVHLLPSSRNPFTAALRPDQTYSIPISHGDGNYRIDPEGLKQLKENAQIAFQYQDNPNGAVDDIAGVSDAAFRVLGMMPHPERAVDPLLSAGTDGKPVLDAILGACSLAAGIR